KRRGKPNRPAATYPSALCDLRVLARRMATDRVRGAIVVAGPRSTTLWTAANLAGKRKRRVLGVLQDLRAQHLTGVIVVASHEVWRFLNGLLAETDPRKLAEDALSTTLDRS